MATLGRKGQDAYHRLLADLDQGHYPPDAALPPGRQLCHTYGVSFPTLQRVVARLAGEQRLRTVPRGGTYVSAPRALGRSRVISFMFNYDQETLLQVQGAALRAGYLLSVFSQPRAHWDVTEERRFLRLVKAEGHHALLAFCTPLQPYNDELLRALAHQGTRVLHLEHYKVTPPEQAYLLPDFRRAGHMGVMNLLLAGYRQLRLTLQGPPSQPHPPYLRLIISGVADALAEHGAGLIPDDLYLPYPTQVHHPAALARLVRQLPAGTGILAASMEYADLLVAALRAAGRSPAEVGVLGIEIAGTRPSGAADVLLFNRATLFERALQAVLAPDWHGPRELVAPVYVAHGALSSPAVPRRSGAAAAPAAP